jgi:hypothetical protein
MILMLITACGSSIKPEQIARVEQNFDEIKPGMTKEEVKKLIGKPYKSGTILYSSADDSRNDTKPVLECKTTTKCSWELWALPANMKQNFYSWPIVVFNYKTSKVAETFRGNLEEYFP